MIILHNGDKDIELLVSDDSYSYEAIMGEDTLTLYFSHPGFLDVPVGSWCDFYGKRYSLKKDSNFKKHGDRNYEYTLVLETVKADTQLWKVRNTVDNRIKFSYTAKPEEHLKLLIDNLNRRSSGWVIGEYVEGTEKTISYSHTYVLDGLSQLAQLYETEWQITEQVKEKTLYEKPVKYIEKKIHLRKVEYNKDAPLKLSYGKGNGFKTGVGRESGEIPPEIILVETTDRNIDFSKYGSKELLLPKSQTLEYEGRTYKTDADGTCVMRSGKDLTTAKEDSLDCTEIYPSREGTVSEVITASEKSKLYDFTDNDVPDALNFEKCLIEGESMTVIFQTGMLAGKEFEVKYFHEAKSEKKARRFELVSQEIDGITMPDGDVWMPKVGDKYAVFGIQLPDAYICDNTTKTGASWDVFKQAAKYLYEHEDKQFTFTGTLDGIWAKKRWLSVDGKIVLGGYVNFSDAQFHPEGSLIRMTGIKRYVSNPYSPEIELSNDPVGTSITSDLNKIETNEVVVDDKHKQALQFTKRRFRDAQETMDMLADSLLNFSWAINPITVATMQMLVGDESLQFRFVNSKTNPIAVNHNITYDTGAKKLNAPSGILQHMTLGIKETSPTHPANAYKYWDMGNYDSPVLIDADKKYYLYAKCSKSAQSGTFLLSETAISMEQITGDYHFLVGVLNSEHDGDRSYVSLYGFTEILPGRITTDKIVSSDGKSYFDLLNASMRLGDALLYNMNGDKTLSLKCVLSENAYLGGWTVKDGKLVSKNENVYLDGDNGKVRLKGTMQLSTGYTGNISDVNLFYLPAITSVKNMTMGYEEEDLGKVVRLYNSSPYGGANYMIQGNKFHRNGDSSYSESSYSVIVQPQEIIEMSCFERPSGGNDYAGEWVVSNRFGQDDFKTSGAVGRFARILAVGHLTGTDVGASMYGDFYDGRALSSICSATRMGTGHYRIRFQSVTVPYGYTVMAVGYGYNYDGGKSPIKATILETSSGYFDIRTSDDASANDGSFDFVVFAPNWKYDFLSRG